MNRRDFLRNCRFYLTATATMCGTCPAAFGSMFSGQNDGEINDRGSMFPSGEPPEPSVVQPPHPVPGSSDLKAVPSTETFPTSSAFSVAAETHGLTKPHLRKPTISCR